MRARTIRVADLATRAVATVDASATLAVCAQRMRREHVGSLVVVDREQGPGTPLGIVTDRDIVIEAIALGLDPATLTAGDVMSAPLATVNADDDVLAALARMRELGARRLPVLDAAGALVGIVAVDNVLEALAEALDSVVRVVKAEQTKENSTRP
jgi:CBS domain-containing protein